MVSPTLEAALGRMLARYKQARWHVWESAGRELADQGGLLAWGRPLDLVPRVANADVLLALDSDLISRRAGLPAPCPRLRVPQKPGALRA